MTETALRLTVLAVVALVVLGFWWKARPDRARPITTHRPDLVPGAYFFSSETCGACVPARRVVIAELGDRVHEIRFEDQPGGFGGFAIARVPTLLVVKEGGEAVLFEGVPTRRQLRGLNP
jgi:hypothetical protein